MENVIATPVRLSKKRVYAGIAISALLSAFMLWDSLIKVLQHPMAMQGTAGVGYPVHLVRPIGVVELASTLLFVVPRTRLFGALLLTAYFGGATATHVRMEQPFVFPVIFGALLWLALYLRDPRLRALVA
jgi:hypothetical protein